MRSNTSADKKNTFAAITLTLAALAVAVGPAPAAAVESSLCEIQVLVDGRPLTEHRARGTTYIEALEGREYSIRLVNRSGRRIAIALAVDGLNSIDAKTTTAERASKWVLGPYQRLTIDGWQVSADNARRFFFTNEHESYGAWLGKTANLGIIEAVVFREKARPYQRKLREGEASKRSGRSPNSAPAAPQPVGEETADDLAATGIGRQVAHRVRPVHLDLEERPAARLALRYEYRQQLVHLGVLPSLEEQEALDRRERARGFHDFEFAPDPWGRR
jgi:hypothetical protein